MSDLSVKCSRQYPLGNCSRWIRQVLRLRRHDSYRVNREIAHGPIDQDRGSRRGRPTTCEVCDASHGWAKWAWQGRLALFPTMRPPILRRRRHKAPAPTASKPPHLHFSRGPGPSTGPRPEWQKMPSQTANTQKPPPKRRNLKPQYFIRSPVARGCSSVWVFLPTMDRYAYRLPCVELLHGVPRETLDVE